MTDNEFKTSDLYFAAYLQSTGVEMLRSDRVHSGKIEFVFDTSLIDIESLKQGWFNKTAKVVASTYAYNIKNLKSVCHMG